MALTGFIGGPGVSTFYAADGPSFQGPLRAFYNAIKAEFPVDVSIRVELNGDTLDPATGILTGTWVGTDTGLVQGTDSGPYSAPVGLLAKWLTPNIADGHRVRGHTFLVPAGASQFDATGQPSPAAIGGLTAACAALVTASSPNFVVWHRPAKARAATATRPARAAHVGSLAIVTGSSAGTKAAVLRSRRD